MNTKCKHVLRFSVSVFVLVALSRWLWGGAAARHGHAWLDHSREQVLAAEPYEIRITALDRGVDAAQAEVAELAGDIGDITAEIATVATEIEELNLENEKDRVLIVGLRQSLQEHNPFQTVQVGDECFSYSDLEHEALLIVDRIHARQDGIAQLQQRASQLELHRDERRTSLRDQQRRLFAVRFEQTNSPTISMPFLVRIGISRIATSVMLLPAFGCGPTLQPPEPIPTATYSSQPIDTPAAILLAEHQLSDLTADVDRLRHLKDEYGSAVEQQRGQVDQLTTETSDLQAAIFALREQRRELASELQSIHHEISVQQFRADRLQSQNLDFLERQLQIAHQRIEALQQPTAAIPQDGRSQSNFESDRAPQTRSADIAQCKSLLRAHMQDSFTTYELIEFSYYDPTILRYTRRAIAYGNCTSVSFPADQLDIVLFANIYPDPVSRRAYYRVRVRCP